MKKFEIAVCLILFLVVPNFAGATPAVLTDTTYFTDSGTVAPEDYIDHGRGSVKWLDGLGDFVKWQHLFSFDPPADTILSGKLTLSLYDDDTDKKWNPFTWEFGGGIAESGEWDIGAINTGSYEYDVDVNYLDDGKFVVKLFSLGGLLVGGDFGICESELEINYKPVPEPATMMLVGLGLFGIAGVRRRFFKKR